ncbi:DMT family transporter [Massilia forsythiae]|uniref:DMT family transporter n=1 Tax=Massilia forsythiae TaxID=2728020 RepID=A0A7Z2VZ71_9BURK|nr:DMT family transporter [Massilia forsythiae]QJE01986.1 DMT family transporter [Massilia forsythiae]
MVGKHESGGIGAGTGVHTNTGIGTGKGIGAGIGAGALWGLVFLAPQLAPGFTPLQLSAGRYLAYGLAAAVLIAPSWRRLAAVLAWRDWCALAWLGFTGNILYYVLLAQAVRGGGVAMAALVIGLLPLAVTLVGSREHGAVALRRLLPSLALGLAGLACTSRQSLATLGRDALPGLLCALGALVSWTVYAVGNSRRLAGLRALSPHDWNLLTGVATGIEALLLALPAFFPHLLPAGVGPDAPVHAAADWLRFAAIAGGVAILCSIVGNGLWNVASRALPLTLMGQMIVFETIFAAGYGFLWERRWPTGLEAAALALLVAGVASCAAVHRRDGRQPDG